MLTDTDTGTDTDTIRESTDPIPTRHHTKNEILTNSAKAKETRI